MNFGTIKAYSSINKLHSTGICSEVMKYDCFVHIMEVLHFEITQQYITKSVKIWNRTIQAFWWQWIHV
jgi:hypothetical protein